VSSARAALTPVDHLDAHAGYSSVWGYTATIPTTRDFALVATSAGTAIVDISTPGAAAEVAFVPGAPGAKRACRTYVNAAYIASSEDGGLQIVSLDDPTAPILVATSPVISRASAFSVDPLLKRLYAAGTDVGVAVLDIADPAAPMLIASYGDAPLEDVFYDTGLVYGGAQYGLAVLDVSGLPSVFLKAWVAYAGNAPAGVWVGEDRRFAYSIDRQPGGRVATISLSPIQNAIRVGTFELAGDPEARPESIVASAENVFVPWGRAGLVVLDVSDPYHPEEIDRFVPPPADRGDTPGLGAVSVFPFASNALVCMTDTDAGLYVLTMTPSVGILEGTLSSAADDTPALSTTISVVGKDKSTVTNNDGTFHLRLAPGEYRVRFTRPDRFQADSTDVVITAGETTTADRALEPFPSGTLRGAVTRNPGPVRMGSAAHPEGTIISFLDAPLPPMVVFDQTYFRPFLPAGTYLIEANEFGYNPVQVEVTVSAGVTTVHDFVLNGVLYSDKFEVDSGWTVGAPDDGATAGVWERVDPLETGGGLVQPMNDESPSPGILAFITGNGAAGDWIDENDVDGGTTSLVSPIYDLSLVEEPIVRYYRWFSNNASWLAEGPDEDTFVLEASNDGGASWSTISTSTRTQLFWREQTHVVSHTITPTAQTRFRFRVSDTGRPSIVEAGVDDFVIYSGAGLMQLPVTPIAFENVSLHATREGSVVLEWIAEGAYAFFAIERAIGQEPAREIGTIGSTGEAFHRYVDAAAPAGELEYWIVGYPANGGVPERAGPLAVRVAPVSPAAIDMRSAPNPFSRAVRIDVAVSGSGNRPAELIVYDVAGRRVRAIFSGTLPPGPHSWTWDGRNAAGARLGPGIYTARLRVGNQGTEEKVVLLD